MSRNLLRVNCEFCKEAVTLEEDWRPPTQEELGDYYEDYSDFSFANAVCDYCGARYLAWASESVPSVIVQRKSSYTAQIEDFETNSEKSAYVRGISDLSFRSTFNDEPSAEDLPQGGIVTSVRVEEGAAHDIVSVWNRNGLAGKLTVTKGDGHRLAERLAPWEYRGDLYEVE